MSPGEPRSSLPRAILEIKWGPLRGTKAVIEAGKTLRVGATDFADLAIPGDRQLSRVHFELSWDGRACRLRDLESQRGTLLGGEKVSEGEVPSGQWIRAGETDFVLHIERATPPRPLRELEDDPDDDELTRRSKEDARRDERARREAAGKALAALRHEAGRERLYAVLDAARDDRILELLGETPEEHRSLYEGIEGETLAHVAPYLVGPMAADAPLLESLLDEGWGKRWGIYLSCSRPFKEVRTHLRRFLMVEVEDSGEKLYFRFYDPECLRIFLPTCSPRQSSELLGPLQKIFGETPEREIALLAEQAREGEG